MALEGLTAAVGLVLHRIFGSRNDRLVRRYNLIAEEALDWEEKFAGLKDEDFPAKTAEFRARLKQGETIEGILPEAFAVARLAADRAIGLRPYKVQLIGGQVLAEGKISEMVTGEGKTLVAVLPNYLQAIAGHVHLVTVNDYLVRRDATWMGPVYKLLGLTTGFIQTPMESAERIPQYAADITYGTNNEFGFDYLRDNMKISRAEQVQGDLNFVIVDEVDSVLIDEARTPLIISGPAFESTQEYAQADEAVRKLKAGLDFEIKEKERTCSLNDRGTKKAEALIGVGSFYIAGNMHWPHRIEQALRAHHLYRKDKEYVVQGDEVIIVDEFTGRLMPGRQWSDGLHQAVEAKEQIRIKEETQTLATITFQNFFRLYRRLAGMTGTAMTEADEFNKIYKLETVAIPTNRPLNRISHPDTVFMTEREKYKAIVDEIHDYSERGRPVLVGTISIENSERLSNALTRTYGIDHEVLSAKHHQREAEIVAQAGQRHLDRSGKECGNVTIATNMAGRGTDIKLGEGVVYKNCHGPWVVGKESRPDDLGNKCCIFCDEYDGHCDHCFKPKIDPAFPKRGRTECRENPPCGLHIVGTERHESRRIDNQLRGRSGRQGDPGSSRFFLCLEDDLMRIFAKDWVTNVLKRLGMEEGMSLEHGFLSRGIEKAQKKVEEHNFNIRKNLLDYDEVMDKQRKVFYGRRQGILEATDLRPTVWNVLLESVDWKLQETLEPEYAFAQIAEWARRNLDVNIKPAALRGRAAEDLEVYLKDRAVTDAQEKVSDTIGEFTEAPEDDAPLPADGEEPLETEVEAKLDYRALANYARERFGLSLSERDLKQMSDPQIDETLRQAAAEKVMAIDCTPLREFLDPDYPLRVLADWLKLKFFLEVPVEALRDRPADQIQAMIADALAKIYDDKERQYPIISHIEAALNRQSTAGGFDFDGLAAWASWYYQTPVTPGELHLETLDQTRLKLLEIADRSAQENALAAAIDRGLSGFLSSDEAAPTDHNLHAIRHWAAESLGVELTPDELRSTTRKPLAEKLLQKAREVRRYDMNNLERYLLLQVYDTSWKDHLYIMDHLKAGVGLRGYAQIDPKIEYKREGLKQFETMLDGINEKFTDLFFKTRSVQREALNRIWSGQSAEHQEIDPTLAKFDAQKQAALEATQAQALEKPKPIVRVGPKIGRNDPCSCGSGKKFKNCCGRN